MNNNNNNNNSEAASAANIPVQQKYVLARPDTLELCDRNKVMRESVVGSLVKEFTGVSGMIRFMVRQNKIQETVRVGLTGTVSGLSVVASPSTVVISPQSFASSVFYDNGLLLRPEIHGQLRQAMKRIDPSLALCRPFIEAIVDKLATVAPPKEASPHGPTATTSLLQFQLDWLIWSHDHAGAGRIAIALAAESADYAACMKFVDLAEEHAALSKLQPTYVEAVPVAIESSSSSSINNNNNNVVNGQNFSEQQQQQQQDLSLVASSASKNNDNNDDDEDASGENNSGKTQWRQKGQGKRDDDHDEEDAFAVDGTKYPPCKMDVMARLDLLGRLRHQKTLIKLLAESGPKLQLGWYDIVHEENLLDSVRKLVASQYRNPDILDVCVKVLISVSHPTAPLFTTALRNVKDNNRVDMALAFSASLTHSHAVPASDRDATLLECVRVLGPQTILLAESSSSSTSSQQQKIIKEVDAAVDSISSDNFSYRCAALLACGRLQDAYRTAAQEAQSVQLVQEVASKCQSAPLNKLKQAKQVVEMCLQYLTFCKR